MSNDIFETAPVHKAYFKMALPVVFGMVVSLVYNMVDTFFIARTGNTNLIAGVALGAPIFTLMIALGDIFGLGGSSLISRLFGEKNFKKAKNISVFSFYASIFIGVIVAIVMLTFTVPILHLLGANADTIAYAKQYYTYIVLGSPAIIFALAPSNILRTEGFASAAMIGSILGSLVNMVLDPLLIFTFGYGAAGAAIATVIGNIVSDIYYIWVIRTKSQRLSMNIHHIGISQSDFRQILTIGIPASITNLMQSVGLTLMNRSLLSYGNDKVAAMGIVMKINMIAVLLMVGFAFGVQPLVGYNYGAKNEKRLKDIMKFSYSFVCGLGILFMILLFVMARHMMGMFVADQHLIEVGTLMLRIQLISMFFIGIVLVTTTVFQSTGQALGALVLSISRQGVIFIVVLMVFSQIFGYEGILFSQVTADILTALLALGLFIPFYKKIR